MTAMIKRAALFALPIGLTACAATAAPPEPAIEPLILHDPTNRCQDLKTSDWYAWLDKMPGPGRNRPTLHVTGKTFVGQHGWTFMLKLGPQSKAHAPRQQIELVVIPSIGSPRIRARTEEIKGRFDGALNQYESIIITCQGRQIAEVVPETVY